MDEERANARWPKSVNAWFGVSLLVVIVGIELTTPAWSREQLIALGIAALVFGSIIAWRTMKK